MTIRSIRATTGAISVAVTVAALVLPIPAVIGWAAYAHTRPASDWNCSTKRDLIVFDDQSGEVATITTCTSLGVTVSRTLDVEA